MAYSMQQMQYYNQGSNNITSSIIQKKYKPFHDPISEVQSKEEFSINADILSSQQMNYSQSKLLWQFDKKNKQGSTIDIIKPNALHNSIEMSQKMSQIFPANNMLQIEEQIPNTPKNILLNSTYQMNQMNSQNLNTNLMLMGDMSLCIDKESNNANELNEKISTTYDASNHLGTKPTTLSFMNQNLVAPVSYSNNFGSNDHINLEYEDDNQEQVVELDKKSNGKKSNFSNLNKKDKQTPQQEIIFMHCPHCKNHIALTQDIESGQNNHQSCGNIFQKLFSVCYSCSCCKQSKAPQNQKCPECFKDIQVK